MSPNTTTSRAPKVLHQQESRDDSKTVIITKTLSWPDARQNLINVLKTRRYSPCTLKAYSYWFQQFSRYICASKAFAHEVVAVDVQNFLSHLAIEQQVSASSQNQAFNALLFFFRWVLKQDLGEIKAIRAKQKRRIPVVLTPKEVQEIMSHFTEPYRLVIALLYGCGLRISEALSLRIQDLDLEIRQLHVFRGKGNKDRTVPLPESLIPELRKQIQNVNAQLNKDISAGYAGVFIEDRYLKKHPKAGKDLAWQWLFPAFKPTQVQDKFFRHHLHDTHVGRAIQEARRKAALSKRITAHSFRHSYATHLLQANHDILSIQQLLGHSDIRTTMIYLHTLPAHEKPRIQSPLDLLVQTHK